MLGSEAMAELKSIVPRGGIRFEGSPGWIRRKLQIKMSHEHINGP